MAKYETMLITSAALDEEATAALVGKFKTLIEANGTIDSIDEWASAVWPTPSTTRRKAFTL